MNVLKTIGKFFLILTEEEKYINSEDIKAILIVNLGEAHFGKIPEVAKKRFQFAQIKIISANTIKDVIFKLRRLKDEQFSMIIVLSLNPLVIFFLILNFNCYFLMYNKFNQWFMIRRKTLYEFLAGRRGYDKRKTDWKISCVRLNFAKCLTGILVSPFIFIRNIIRVIKLTNYILISILGFFIRKYYYKILFLKRRL